jgi:hypothetical protein
LSASPKRKAEEAKGTSSQDETSDEAKEQRDVKSSWQS